MAVKRIGNIAINYDDSYLQPSPQQTEIYNMLGQGAGTNTGDQNFFQKKWNSIENAFGTTGAAIASPFINEAHTGKTEGILKGTVSGRDDIARKYGFNNIDDLYNALDNAEKMGDTETANRLYKAEQEDKDFTSGKASEMKSNIDEYKDYLQNNYVSQKINQDRGKFAGSAINTLSTATDIAGLTNGPISNAIQGGIEGIADELEQNGLENFSWERARDNAITGAVTGAAIGAVNKGMSNALAKNGGNLFKGSNKVTKTLNNLGSSTPLGRAASTVATGAGRGAISGAVGGATGAATQSALSGADIGTGFSNTIQGAVRGAQQGATTGATMAGTNMVLNKTPGVGKFMRELNQVSDDWRNSGNNFDERLTNTLTSGDSAVGDWLMNKRQSKLLGTVGNLGDRIQDVSGQTQLDLAKKISGNNEEWQGLLGDIAKRANKVEGQYVRQGRSSFENDLSTYDNANKNVLETLGISQDLDGPQAVAVAQVLREKGLITNTQGGDLGRFSKKYDRTNFGEADLQSDTSDALNEFVEQGNENDRVKLISEIAERAETLKGQPRGKYGTNPWSNDLFEYSNIDSNVLDELGISGDLDGASAAAVTQVLKERGIIPSADSTPTTAKGWLKQAGKRIIEDANNKGVGLSIKNVANETPDDIQNMRVNNNVPNVKRTLDDGNIELSDGTIVSNLDGDNTELFSKTRFDGFDLNESVNNSRLRATNAGLNPDEISELAYQDLQTRGINSDKLSTRKWAQEISNSFDNAIADKLSQTKQIVSSPETELYRRLTGQNNSAWDNVAREAGYSNYDELTQRFKQANPDMEATASNILDWADAQSEGIDTGIAPQKTSKEAKLRYAQGEELLKQYGVVDQPMSRSVNGAETFQSISDMGFQKPADVERMATAITGANGAVSDFMRNVVRSAEPVDTYSGVKDGQSIDDFIDESIELNALYGTPQGAAIKKTLEANLRSLPSKSAGSVTFEDSAEDVFKVVQKMEKKAAELEGRGGTRYMRPTQENLSQAKVIKDVANLLKERIYAGADVETALTPEASRQLKALAPDNGKWSSTVDEFFAKAKTPQDLRSFQKPWVNASRYIDNQYTQAATFGGRMTSGLSNAVPTTKAGLVKQAVDTVWNSNPAHRARAKLYGKVADIATGNTAETPIKVPSGQDTSTPTTEQMQLTSSTPVTSESASTQTSTYNPSTQIYDLIGRNEGLTNAEQVRTANYLTDAVNQANATNLESLVAPSSTGSSTSVYNSVYGTSTTPTAQTSTGKSYFPTTGDYWTDILGSAMTSAIDADDAEAFGQLYAMYQEAVSKQASSKDYSNPVNWSTSDRSSLLKAQNGLDQIDQLAESYTNAVGEGSNVVQGTLRQWSNNISAGNLDPSAENYVKQANSIGAGIIKNLVNLGSTEYDAERYIDYLPKLTDTKEQAAQKLQTLRNAYQNVINNLYSVYNV